MTDNLSSILAAGANPTGPTGTIALLVVAVIAILLFILILVRKDSPALTGLALLLLRVPLGAYFLLVSIPKVKREINSGFGTFASSSASLVPHWMPASAGHGYLLAVPWVELIVGILLIIGLLTRLIGLIATLMIISFTIAFAGIRADGNPAFTSNVMLIAVAMAVMLLGAGKISADSALPRRKKK
jgi:uncharacterized membrane protein YphA (DoxX/SURF4 family)